MSSPYTRADHPYRHRALSLLSITTVALLALGACLPAQATGRYSRSQLASLPPYCADSELSHDYVRMGPRWQYWTARMGSNFNRIHHYCQGLLDAAEARKSPPGSQSRVVMLKRAMMEYNFLLGMDQSELKAFPLWPEMLVRRGEIAVLLEDWALAYSSYDDARRIKPDYPPAYIGWADVLVKLNKREDARVLLKQGLMIMPAVESMRQAYLKLGGSLADIPDVPPEPAVRSAAASAATAASKE